MQVKFDVKYERSKQKVALKIDVKKIIQTEELFVTDMYTAKLQLKNIACRRDKNKKSIRILGNDGYRILISMRDDTAYFQDIMNHDKYDRLTKDC